jgi:hypothetical protein
VPPVKAIAMNALAVGASFGDVVPVFQHGYPSGLLHFTSTGTVELTQPILVLVILVRAVHRYEVFLISRIREDGTPPRATPMRSRAPCRAAGRYHQRGGADPGSDHGLLDVADHLVKLVRVGMECRAGRRDDRAGPPGAGHDAAARAVDRAGAAGPRLVGSAPPTAGGLATIGMSRA